MGADLCAHILKGPMTLPVTVDNVDEFVLKAKEIIQKRLDELLDELKQQYADEQATGLDEGTDTSRLYVEDPWWHEGVRELAREYMSAYDIATDAPDIEFWLDDALLRTLLLDVVEAWTGNYRDTALRPDPDDPTQQLWVAGEMTWGDTPQGGGYTAMTGAAALDLLQLFDIR